MHCDTMPSAVAKGYFGMLTTAPTRTAAMTFAIDWQSEGIHHIDCRHASPVNFYRDVFDPRLKTALMGKAAGERIRLDYAPGQAVAVPDPGKVHRLNHDRLNRDLLAGGRLQEGRFYPQGLLKGLAGVFRGNTVPFRCLTADDQGFTADCNHPMAGRPFRLDVEIHRVDNKDRERGGPSNDWVELSLEGPGMQARANGRPTVFFTDQAFARQDEAADSLFYGRPRLINHIDDQAIAVIQQLYGRLLKPQMAVLDLMSSWTSHLPAEPAPLSVTGLGLNETELKANDRLDQIVVHDLNADPRLPFGPESFDAIICSVSVEYLIHPLPIFAEAARVLKPSGLLAVTFSDRWFPPKAIQIWQQLHPFERMGLVLEMFLHSGRFADLETFSMQGLDRPDQDKYALERRFSDPVFAVWGYRR
jgi:SAM-dependent methyltransferase